ncbi:hypothetical protein, partial [Hydrogenivirga sp. 128-5-R1-1]|uniref:hypothetical protein n=1 Tax=Hydrogenivirga sp. 128-5-R1-1 TaxID=392423 RepID=UPI000516F1C0
MKKILHILLFLFLYVSLSFSADINYSFGRGLKVGKFTLGGYSAFVYENNNKNSYEKFNWEELAFLGFIDITDKFKFFTEIELKDIYVKSSNSNENKTFNIKDVEINRLYFDYIHNDYFKIRFGRFITPLGYWNPIYVIVLRWTTSNPITSTQFYPRFLTGIRIFGYLPFQNDSWEYDLMAQAGKQINEDNNSLITKNFYAFQLKKHFKEDSTFGITGGYFEHKNKPEKVKFIGFNISIKGRVYEFTSEYFYQKR